MVSRRDIAPYTRPDEATAAWVLHGGWYNWKYDVGESSAGRGLWFQVVPGGMIVYVCVRGSLWGYLLISSQNYHLLYLFLQKS